MSIWTSTDRANVKAAILDLVAGKRVVSTEVAGKTRSFGISSLPALRDLLEDIDGDVVTQTQTPGARRVRTIPVGDSW